MSELPTIKRKRKPLTEEQLEQRRKKVRLLWDIII